MRPDITDAAYQISPALLLTRLCNGKLQRASSERAKAGIGDSQNSPNKEIWGLRDVHLHRLRPELEQRKCGESRGAHRDESTVCLVSVQEPRLEREREMLRN